jgi:carotenoid 1,2-hydratase
MSDSIIEQEKGTAEASARPPGYESRGATIDFAQTVPDNGYLWWYVDAISDDGTQAMTLIVFVGSVFSPYYARARRRSAASAENHCAFNAILYGPGSRKRWSMTERSERHLERSAHSYSLGPSRMDWDGQTLLAQVDERCVPLPKRMRGTIRVTPETLTTHTLLLDENGLHRWHPLAPIARVEVDFPTLGTRWSGHGYFDSNEGNEPLADGFIGWDWARVRLDNGDCAVRYEAREPLRQPRRLALRFSPDGQMHSETAVAAAPMDSTSIWRMARRMPSPPGAHQLLRTFEDTPFYARSLISTEIDGMRGTGVHESLSMQRFTQRWVQTLLPFRMPRVR